VSSKASDGSETPEAEVTIEGIVVSEGGEPMADVGVVVMNVKGARTTTDAKGRFALAVELPDFVSLLAYDPETKSSAGTHVWMDAPVRGVRVRVGEGSTVEFPTDSFLEAQARMNEAMEPWGNRYQAALREAVDEPSNRILAKLAFDRAYPRKEQRDWFHAKIDTAEDPRWRRVLLLNFFSIPSMARGYGDASPDAELAEELLSSIEPDSDWWEVSPRAMWNAVTETGDVAAWEEYLERAIASDDGGVLAGAVLGERFLDAWSSGNIEDANRLAERIRGLDGPGRVFAHAELSNFEAAHGDLRVGASVPAFEWTSRGDEVVSNASLAGRPYLLFFWAPWCGACKQDVPALKQLYAEQAERVRIISVAVTDPATLDEFEAERGPLPWTHVVIADSDAEGVHERFTSSTFPTWLLIDADGTILETSRNFPMSTPGHSRLYDRVIARLP
jgi:thiol-disulfide isomerase/thioredoxin